MGATGLQTGGGTGATSTTSSCTGTLALENGGVINGGEKKAGKITLAELDERFNRPGMSETVEEKLGVRKGAFKLKRQRRHIPYLLED